MKEHFMNITNFFSVMRPAIEENLQLLLDEFLPKDTPELGDMVRYHMGWIGENAGLQAQGKRIRPMLTLLSSCAAGGEWQANLNMASAIEYIHNFSLIHDDIQDQSPLRRGRPTVWAKWGTAQAINTGDFMFTLAHLCGEKLINDFSPEIVLQAICLLDNACVELTQGQHLDLWFENHSMPTTSQYWKMIKGKTAALLGCATEMGGLLGGASKEQQFLYQEFGVKLGLAFQVIDDWLGIWGDQGLTGKSNESDLVTGKKTLPILFAFENSIEFASRWKDGGISAKEIPEISKCMIESGAQEYTEKMASHLTKEAISALEKVNPSNIEVKSILIDLALELTHRQK